MSYSLFVQAATKAEAKQKVEAEFDKVVDGQPIEARSKAAALANANTAIDLLADDDTQDVAVSCTGGVTFPWQSGDFDVNTVPLSHVSLSASAVHQKRATAES